MTDESTDAQSEAQPSRSAWPFAALGSLFLAALMLIVAWNLELPYLAYSPGPVADALDGIEADTSPVDDPDGDLLMLTIIGQPVNLIEAILARFDPSIDLVKREFVRRPDETDVEYRSRVLAQMSDSNHRSITTALEHLGYEMVPVEVIIEDVAEGVPAEGVLRRGDAIVAIEGLPVTAAADLTPLVQGRGVGDTLSLTVARDEEEIELEVVLAEREDSPGVAMIGIFLGEITEPPFPIRIRTGDVGGPSAGLMHTLAIIDVLTEGNLTKGHVIAGTGTIDPVDGRVGAIGGVRQKVVAAEAAGASHILVPADNYATALEAPRHTIEIVAVSSLEDALAFLETLPPT